MITAINSGVQKSLSSKPVHGYHAVLLFLKIIKNEKGELLFYNCVQKLNLVCSLSQVLIKRVSVDLFGHTMALSFHFKIYCWCNVAMKSIIF